MKKFLEVEIEVYIFNEIDCLTASATEGFETEWDFFWNDSENDS